MVVISRTRKYSCEKAHVSYALTLLTQARVAMYIGRPRPHARQTVSIV